MYKILLYIQSSSAQNTYQLQRQKRIFTTGETERKYLLSSACLISPVMACIELTYKLTECNENNSVLLFWYFYPK